MKILFLTHKFFPDIGGIEVNSEILAQGFTNAGHTVHLATWSQDSTNQHFPYEVIRNPSIKRLLSEHTWADIVFENNPSLRLSWPGVIISRPYIVAVRTWISRQDGKKGVQDRLKFWRLRYAKAVIAVSDSIRKKCWSTSFVIGNPYRASEFKIIPGLNRKNDFVFLGRLVSDKGANLAILAIHHLLMKHNAFNKISLTLIGDGPDRMKLEKLVTDLNLDHHVNFTGPLRGSELIHCLNSHKYLLVPSMWEEPFGNVALEGMACGCIPIVSDGGGLPDAVGQAGLVFKRGDLNSLINAIISLLRHPALEEKFQKSAADHLKAHSPEVVSEKYLEIINRAIKVK